MDVSRRCGSFVCILKPSRKAVRESLHAPNDNRYHLCILFTPACVCVSMARDRYSVTQVKKRETGARRVNHKGTRVIKSRVILQVSGYKTHLTRSARSGCAPACILYIDEKSLVV